MRRSENQQPAVWLLRRPLWLMLASPLFLLLLPSAVKAQPAGMSTLSVFDMATTSRSAALGMDYVSLPQGGLETAVDNPSLLPLMEGSQAVGAFLPMFDGSNATVLAYGWQLNDISSLSVGMRMFNYGRFYGYDEEENYEGDFGAGDYSLYVGWGLKIDEKFSIGVNFKPVLSQYEHYTALAQAFDISASYNDGADIFAATLMARNIGAQLLTFNGTFEPLPYELSAAMSYKLRGAPFRIYVAATELQRWNLRYEDPLHPSSTTDSFTGEVQSESFVAAVVDNLMRHMQAGIEISVGKMLRASVGYNYRQGREMIGADILNMSAFSFGVALHTRRFDFGYAHRSYHLAQAPNYLTFSYRF